MMDLTRIPVGVAPPEDINVVVEVPRGGDPVKYEIDKVSGAVFVDRFLHTAMFYPGNYGWLLSASGVMEARGGGFGYDDGSRRSAVAGEHEGFLSSWPQRTRSTSHPCSMTRNASPWCASTAGQRASVALDAAATR